MKLEIIVKLNNHALWLETNESMGERADLRGADLRDANLRGADLDFSSGIPFHCGGTNAKGDLRLAAQMSFHLFEQDWSELDEEDRALIEQIKPLAEKFKRFGGDVNV